MVGAGAESEDASQEVFMRIHRSIEGFDATRPLAPWISRITYNVCLRRLQRQGRNPARSTDQELMESYPDRQRDNPEQRVAREEVDAVVDASLSTLPAQDRALLVMRYREGMSVAEVAEATGMPANTVKTRLFRARGRLREQLAPLVSGLSGGSNEATL